MKSRYVSAGAFLLLWCGGLHAQAVDRGTMQIGFGGSYARSNRLPEKNGFGGFLFTASYAQSRWLRWTGIGGFEFAGSPVQPIPPEGIPASAVAPTDQMLSQFHVGPEFTRYKQRTTFFAHALPGYTGWSLGQESGEGGRGRLLSEGGFSLAVGGGVDIPVRRSVELRFQGDYIPAWIGQGIPNYPLTPSLPLGGSPYQNFRVAMMVIFTTRDGGWIRRAPSIRRSSMPLH